MHMIVMIDQTQRIVNRKRSFCALLLACLANTYHNRILFLECQEHIRSEFRLRTSQKMRDNAIKIRRTVNQWPLFTHLSQKHMPNLRQIAFFFFFFFFFFLFFFFFFFFFFFSSFTIQHPQDAPVF